MYGASDESEAKNEDDTQSYCGSGVGGVDDFETMVTDEEWDIDPDEVFSDVGSGIYSLNNNTNIHIENQDGTTLPGDQFLQNVHNKTEEENLKHDPLGGGYPVGDLLNKQ